MKCMNRKGLGAYQVKRNLKKLEESLRKRFEVKKESVWEMNNRGQIERDRRNERRIVIEKYIDPSVMLDS